MGMGQEQVKHNGHSETQTNLSEASFRRLPIKDDLKELVKGEWITYSSKSERACARLLESFVPGWEPKIDKTFQVKVDHKHSIDFKVSGVFVEWHPINLMWQFKNRTAFRNSSEAMDRVRPVESEKIEAAISKEFKTRYINSRREILNTNHPKAELIVATTPREFVQNVIERFGESKLGTRLLIELFNTERDR